MPRWVDPEDPSLFTLVRHAAIAGLLGIGSLVALALVLGAVARRLE